MSTILKALRKLEEEHTEEHTERPGSDPVELDRQILVREKSEGVKQWRRVAGVAVSVLLSGITGVGFTLAVLAYWPSRPPSLLAAQADALAAEANSDVVVVADVLKQRIAAGQLPPRSLADDMQPKSAPAPRPIAAAKLATTPVARVDAADRAPVAIVMRKHDPVVREQALATMPKSKAPKIPEIARPSVPQIVVMGTVWHPRAERRRAELSVEEDGKTRTVVLREGELLGPLRVAEIGPLAVTFVLDSVEIEYRVGATRTSFHE